MKLSGKIGKFGVAVAVAVASGVTVGAGATVTPESTTPPPARLVVTATAGGNMRLVDAGVTQVYRVVATVDGTATPAQQVSATCRCPFMIPGTNTTNSLPATPGQVQARLSRDISPANMPENAILVNGSATAAGITETAKEFVI